MQLRLHGSILDKKGLNGVNGRFDLIGIMKINILFVIWTYEARFMTSILHGFLLLSNSFHAETNLSR